MEEVEVTVHSNLPEGEPQGTFHIILNENSKVSVLIRKVCSDNAIPLKSSYVLRNKDGHELNWSTSVKENVQTSGKEFYLWNTAEEVTTTGRKCDCNIWWFIGGISLVIGILGLIAIIIMFLQNGKTEYEYGVVMDAGSSHTTLYVYKWSGEKYKDTALAVQADFCKVSGPSISSYTNNLQDLAKHLEVCLDKARNTVPADKHATTPIYLGATAGMRLLHAVNTSQSEAILSVIRTSIKKYPFMFNNATQQARIISGDEEGLYSWVTSNYVTGSFGVKKPLLQGAGKSWQMTASGDGTVGAMDLGGASTQMTFYPGSIAMPPAYEKDLTLFGLNYSIYTHSYLCYGVNEITRKYQALLIKNQNYTDTVSNPCGPLGKNISVPYTEVFEAPCTSDSRPSGIDRNTTFQLVGESDNAMCHQTVQQLFNMSTVCPQPPCTFNGTYQPKVYGKYYAFSNFYYVMEFLNLTSPKMSPETKLSDVVEAVGTLCEKPWSEVRYMKTDIKYLLPEFCFRGRYILTLLHEAYKFDDDDGSWRKISFVNNLDGTEIGWSLGYMISQSVHVAAVTPKTVLPLTTFILLVLLFCVFLCLSVGFAIHAIKSRKFETKGKYQQLSTTARANYGAL
ncbi:ectonucleoside triphosphate diphosphohydrolase 1-like [Mizuhopecten yessoensis]|uniref:ectonucleoside triphosphate diphosphohydrolase 1-like n=1 Tax=Mizuhopecten yessoensis TaxID=6573 RepID=UPI000B45DCB9|nr:ectonucleoside triphosphate diphosphohydrolase 1-like [Mizuhopecten yessoensis]XP_021352888.1 ectonucleoside triphosphate diphosphohydrolase 1-like [Mizuhopecten yessoensis]XP_021352889.1 ectonucleoside triphosphate diphosphohydrolase 1-like [Mizuhopecten yessoensis]XP_021352890.1 ectonucleoside triphosphate diphosphohydrolase 1-like [Mizuhopecten yessoensis]